MYTDTSAPSGTTRSGNPPNENKMEWCERWDVASSKGLHAREGDGTNNKIGKLLLLKIDYCETELPNTEETSKLNCRRVVRTTTRTTTPVRSFLDGVQVPLAAQKGRGREGRKGGRSYGVARV